MNDQQPKQPKRRWWQFSIRELMMLMIIVVLAIGWSADRAKLWEIVEWHSVELRSMRVDLERLNYEMEFLSAAENE